MHKIFVFLVTFSLIVSGLACGDTSTSDSVEDAPVILTNPIYHFPTVAPDGTYEPKAT